MSEKQAAITVGYFIVFFISTVSQRCQLQAENNCVKCVSMYRHIFRFNVIKYVCPTLREGNDIPAFNSKTIDA